VAQPLIFAIQSAATRTLRDHGLVPHFVLGHSIGEIAAAEAAGILDLESAVRLVYYRSLHQEMARGRGCMAVLVGAVEAIKELLSHVPDVEIAAVNSPRAFTVSGSAADLDQLAKMSRGRHIRMRRLDLDYAFHSRAMAPIEAALLRDLSTLAPVAGHVDFISTVSARLTPGQELDSRYWWHNIREPVRFMETVREAARLGARLFVEIGPAPVLLSHINDSLDASGHETAGFCVLNRKEVSQDPLRMAVTTVLARGGRVDAGKVFGDDPGASVTLPFYPWQRKPYRLADSSEGPGPGLIRAGNWHPLIGARHSSDGLEWQSTIDTSLVPSLADHRIDGTVLLPGSAFVEMALAVARDWLGSEAATVVNLEVLLPMPLAGDSARDVLCRVSPAIDLLEIFSRPRLSTSAWQLHAKAKILRQPVKPGRLPPPVQKPVADAPVDSAELYGLARQAGLDFGPAYRQLRCAWRVGNGTVRVDLLGAEPDRGYGLDPAQLDSCFHGLVLLFNDLAGGAPLRTAYLPIAFGEVQLYRRGVAIAHAQIDISSFNERAIQASFLLLDDSGQIIARLRDARFRAVSMVRDSRTGIEPVHQVARLAVHPTAPIGNEDSLAPALREAARSLGCLQSKDSFGPADMLLEGWATSISFQTALRLARSSKPDSAMQLSLVQLPAEARSWFHDVLVAVQRSGLARASGDIWRMEKGVDLPAPDLLLRHFATTCGENSAELILAAGAAAALDALANGDIARFARPTTLSAIENFDNGSPQAKAAARQLTLLLEQSEGNWPRDRALSVLQIGCGPLTQRALGFLQKKQARLTIFDPDRTRLERTRLSCETNVIQFVDALAALPRHAFGLVISTEALRCLGKDPSAWSAIRHAMSGAATFVAIEPLPSLFRELVFGLDAVQREMAQRSAGLATKPIAFIPALSNAAWQAHFRATGFTDFSVDHISTGVGPCSLLTASTAREREDKTGDDSILLVGDGDAYGTEITTAVATLLASSGFHVSIELDDDLIEHGSTPRHLAYFAIGVDHSRASHSLSKQCLRLKQCAQGLGGNASTLWLVTSGASGVAGSKSDAIAAGVWAFSRTLANEFPNLTVRRVDLAYGLSVQQIGERLRDLMVCNSQETEIVLSPESTRVLRFLPNSGRRLAKLAETEAIQLQRGNGVVDRLHWTVVARRPPNPGEVEIAVTATGLNFRDVMLSLGLLPEDLLENGFAGASLGLACTGKIIRVGADVKEFQSGDRVVAFAKAAFATHVTVSSSVVAPLPDTLTKTAAATIPWLSLRPIMRSSIAHG
jgi:malonyl CoA-acyl carrier protein transacylase